MVQNFKNVNLSRAQAVYDTTDVIRALPEKIPFLTGQADGL